MMSVTQVKINPVTSLMRWMIIFMMDKLVFITMSVTQVKLTQFLA
jgi:hypothetical protein